MAQLSEKTIEALAELMRKSVARRLSAYPSWPRLKQEVEDITQSAILALLKWPESNFRNPEAVARRLANTAVYGFMRSRFPVRKSLDDSARYYIGKCVGIECRENNCCVEMIAYTEWFTNPPKDTVRLEKLEDDTKGTSQRIFDCGVAGKKAIDLIHHILEWVGCPVPFDVVIEVLAEATGRRDFEGEIIEEPEDERNLPDKTYWIKENLERLWLALISLVLRQIQAVLLNLRDHERNPVIDDLRLAKVCTFEDIAGALQFEAQYLADIWNELPWEDKQIAAFMNCTALDVSNLRSLARRQLEKRLGPDFASVSLSWR